MTETTTQSERAPVTLITGASRGIGLALAHEFGRAGHTLVLTARNRIALEDVTTSLSEAYGIEVHAQAGDLATAQGCEALAETINRAGLEVDYLVNNAAIGQCGPFHEADRELLTGLIDLNVAAPTDLTRRFLPGMIARKSGGVLNVASLGGFAPGPYQASYMASKAFVVSLTEALANEVWQSGVKMAVLTPGPVASEFHENAGSEHSYYIRFLGVLSAERVARIAFANFMCGQTVIIPGWSNMLSALTMRLTPHFLMVPFNGWLLKRRERPGDAAEDA